MTDRPRGVTFGLGEASFEDDGYIGAKYGGEEGLASGGSRSATDAAYDEEEENPFKIPAESEITTYRDRERAEKSAERQRQKQLRVYEKLGNRMRRLRVTNTTTLAEAEAAAAGSADGSGVQDADLAAAAPGNQKAHDLAIATRDRHIEKEQLQDYIEKKREMFLVQYALEVKKNMMEKLAEETEFEEKKLDSAEQQLEADAAKFDQFLKDNDRNSAAAIKEAETQTMLKSEKTSEIKALQSEIATLRSDISKNEDQLKEFHTYRKFLNGLAPQPWLDAERTQFEAKKKELRASSLGGNNNNNNNSAEDDNMNFTFNGPRSGGGGRRRSGGGGPEVPQIEPSPANPAADPELEALDAWDPQLFFSSPKELLDIYAELEAHNLSLITNGQETEEALQDLEERSAADTRKMEHEVDFLASQIAGLEHEIGKEEDNCWLARERTSYFSASNLDKQEDEMKALDVKVAAVYEVCIGENEANISTLQMLTNIENRLEELFESIAKMPPAKVEEAERTKEKQRRIRLREEKIEAQRVHQEERVRKALERAQAAPKRQTGRKLVFRSAPPKQKKLSMKKRVMATEEEEEMRYYFGQ